jgi:hypothetical protein
MAIEGQNELKAVGILTEPPWEIFTAARCAKFSFLLILKDLVDAKSPLKLGYLRLK